MAAIDRIEVLAIGPNVPRTTWASMPPQFMTLTLVRVWDSDGAEGLGATETYADGQFDVSVSEALRALAPRVIGKEALDREARWRDLQTLVMPSPAGAVAAIDIALWDLASRRANMPLYQFLGGARDTIRAYASTPEWADAQEYVAQTGSLLEAGFRAIKFHAWNVPDRDLEMLRLVHRHYGSQTVAFMHDAENRYDRRSSLRVARELQDMNFRWFEAPFIDYDLAGYAELRRRVEIPIIPHGLWFTELSELRYALDREPWDAVRFDCTVVGGLTAARKICALAEAYGLDVEPQSWGYSLIQAPNLHLGLSTSGVSYFELPVPYEAYEFGVENPIRLSTDGHINAPTDPGLGLIVDWDAIRKSTLTRIEISG